MAKKKISITIDGEFLDFIKAESALLKGGVSGWIQTACNEYMGQRNAAITERLAWRPPVVNKKWMKKFVATLAKANLNP